MTDLKRVLDLIRADEKAQARALLIELLQTDRRNEQAWLYLAVCAANKREFESSIQQVLKLNPLNSTALKQAQKHGLTIPEAAKQAKKKGQKSIKSKGRRGLRLLLLLLLVMVAIAVGVLLAGRKPKDTAEVETVATAEATEEATSEVTPTATEESTEEIPIPTAEATEPIVEIVATPTLDLPISETPQGYVEGMRFLTGSEDELEENLTPPGDAALFIEIRLRDHGEDLKLQVAINSKGGNQNLLYTAEAPAQPAHTVLIPVKAAGEIWPSSIWQAELRINDVRAFLAETFIIPPLGSPTPVAAAPQEGPSTTQATATQAAPTATVTPNVTATPAISPTPTIDFPDVDISLRLTYNPSAVYIQNISTENVDISGLRFVQNLEGGNQVAFNATEWELQPGSQAAGTIYNFQPERCFQIGTERSTAQQKASECTVLNAWQERDLEGQFWLINNGNFRTFLVLQNGIPLTECAIDAGLCEFGLLPQ